MDTGQTIQSLLKAEPLRQPVLQSMIHSIHLPFASRGLDAGCGIGLQALWLADAIGPAGHVTGLDVDPELLLFGEKLVTEAGLSGRINFQAGDVFTRLPFESESFNWVWSMDCIGYPAGDLAPILKELMRVVKPGGRILVSGWSGQQILPGYSLLEARLNASCSGYLPFLQGIKPEQHFLRSAGRFEEVGLDSIKVHTFLGEVQAPLSEGERKGLTDLFAMLWGQRQDETSSEDWQAFQQLCNPDSPDFILDQAGYYAFFTYTLFEGKVPNNAP